MYISRAGDTHTERKRDDERKGRDVCAEARKRTQTHRVPTQTEFLADLCRSELTLSTAW